MIVFPVQTLSGVGASSILQPYGTNGIQFGQNNGNNITSLGLICTVSAGASLTYSVQVTADQAPSAGGNWNDHDVLTALTASKNSNILYGISGIRLSVSIWSSGSVTLGTVQWP